MIAIIDYGAGNIGSVEKALGYIGAAFTTTRDAAVIKSADKVILPGVGAFGDAMNNLDKSGLCGTVREVIADGVPFLGICVGLQMLFESSMESPGVSGLGIFKGTIERIPKESGLKIPHIGWNSLSIKNGGGIFKNVEPNPFVYFVHSYYLNAADKDIVAATADYGVTMDVAVAHKNVTATQFHLEKSGMLGINMLKNFVFGGKFE